MLLNGMINVIDIEVSQPEDANHIEVGLICGLPIPTAPNQVGLLPAAKLRFILTERGDVEDLADELKKLAVNLPKASGIEVASNLNEVEQAAERLEKLRGTNGPSR